MSAPVGDAPLVLDDTLLARGVAELVAADPDLAAVVERNGPPPLWARPHGFATLVNIVLEQQVSLASARAAFDRLRAATDAVTPTAMLDLSDAELLAIGFSRQKARYARLLARSILEGNLDLEALAALPDVAARARLCTQTGIGPWTADIYLLMALRRPDVWPRGDLALHTSLQTVRRLPSRPTDADAAALAASWRPWRAVAARLLWHDYLARRARPSATAGG